MNKYAWLPIALFLCLVIYAVFTRMHLNSQVTTAPTTSPTPTMEALQEGDFNMPAPSISNLPMPSDVASPLPSPQLSVTPTPMSSITPINKVVIATITTSMGDIVVSLDGTKAPMTVGNFVQLAKSGFYDSTTFHRVIPNFMIQGGDPLSKDPSQRMMHGTGDPGYKFEDEINDRQLVRGSLAMANSGPNTNGSQFFIVTTESTPWLDGKHTNFGEVTKGMDVVDKISAVQRDANDNPLTPVTIQKITIQEKVTK